MHFGFMNLNLLYSDKDTFRPICNRLHGGKCWNTNISTVCWGSLHSSNVRSWCKLQLDRKRVMNENTGRQILFPAVWFCGSTCVLSAICGELMYGLVSRVQQLWAIGESCVAAVGDWWVVCSSCGRLVSHVQQLWAIGGSCVAAVGDW